MKQITHVAIAKTYPSMKARDVKNENQMKSSFFHGKGCFSLVHMHKHKPKHKTSENTKLKHKDIRTHRIDKTADEVKYCILSF